jgi:hypothetical protein
MILNLPKIDQFFKNINEVEGRNDENEGFEQKS